jgi:hypothetical protein
MIIDMEKEKKLKPRERAHYVNNALFSAAVVEYVIACKESEEKEEPYPIVTNYIAECFLKINEGLSHKANFGRYTYREEMMMDGVEDCLKRIKNFKIETKTRTGKPNAFSYFTQIAWFAFLRRIAKEKKQQAIKVKYMNETGLDNLIQEEMDANPAARATHAFVEELRQRIDFIKDKDKDIKDYSKKETKKRRAVHADSDLSSFL